MWIIRVLAGPQKDQMFPLRLGKNIIGRDTTADIRLLSPKVSKSHAQILFTGDKLILEDLNSRNGCLVNGIKIQQKLIKAGDRISIDELFLELSEIDERKLLNPVRTGDLAPLPKENYPAQLSPQMHPSPHDYDQEQPGNSGAEEKFQDQVNPSKHSLFRRVEAYLEDVVLPGVYRLGHLYDFRWVLALFVGAFVILSTLFSTIPMSRVTKENIQNESQRRALTIAKNLALMNRNAIRQHMTISLDTRIAQMELGVEEALIVSADSGVIMAPAQRAGSYANEPFIQRIRQENKERSELLSPTKIAATVPISVFDPELGTPIVRAHAVIFYNMEKTAVDTDAAISLYIQSTFGALLLSLVLYFLLLRFIQHPINDLNNQLNQVLSHHSHQITMTFKNAELGKTASHINNILARSTLDSSSSDFPQHLFNKDLEVQKIVNLIGWASCTFDIETEKFTASNDAFEDLGFSSGGIVGHGVDSLLDPALKESLKDILLQITQGGQETHSNQLPLQSHETLEIRGQKIVISEKDLGFVLLVFMPSSGELEESA